MRAPVFGSASKATSGSPRTLAAAVGTTPLCQAPLFSTGEAPPPPAFHAASEMYAPEDEASSVVPPTATAYGEDAGYSVSGSPDSGTPLLGPTAQELPVSPVEAKKVWPCAAAWASAMSSTIIEPSRNGRTSHSPSEAEPDFAVPSEANRLIARARSELVSDVAM